MCHMRNYTRLAVPRDVAENVRAWKLLPHYVKKRLGVWNGETLPKDSVVCTVYCRPMCYSSMHRTFTIKHYNEHQ